MVSKTTIKFIKSLKQKKFRIQHGCFSVEGPKMVDELLQSDFRVRNIIGTASWIEKQGKSSGPANELVEISAKDLERISGLKTPNQVLAVAEIPKWKVPVPKDLSGLVLALDGISDPGNLGTILRIADWFGIREVICSEDTVDVFNPKVVQASMGSLFRVRVVYGHLADFLNNPDLKLLKFGAVMDGENIYKKKLPAEGLLVIGSESHGISPGVASEIDVGLTIPASAEATESLNAAVATGIICSEFRRGVLQGK